MYREFMTRVRQGTAVACPAPVQRSLRAIPVIPLGNFRLSRIRSGATFAGAYIP